MAITPLSTNLNNVQALADQPNATSGLTPSQVKATFDAAGNAIKTYINETMIPEIDAELVTQTDLTTTRKLSASGDFTGSWFGVTNPAASEPGIQGAVEALQADVAQRGVNVCSHPFNADPTGTTDSTAAIQAALNYAATLYGGDDSVTAGYMGWYMPEVIFPTGTYLCGQVTIPERIRISGIGQSVIKSLTGTSSVPAGYFVNNQVTNLEVKRLTFLYFDTAFRVPTGNNDFSFITFDECHMAKTNVFVDTVSFAESRSTSFKMTRCNISYGVTTLCKVYTDKSLFEGNWFNHSMNSIFMYLDSYATFKDNLWVPSTGAGTSKAYISFSASDSVRNLDFKGERFGGESGSCPIVVVGDVNGDSALDAYRQQGITFDDCFMASNSTYNPDGVAGVKACVILKPTISANRSINFVSFKSCAFLPDLSGGVVQPYNVSGDITTLLPSDFVIDFDYASAVSATKGANKPTSSNLQRYVQTPILSRKTAGHNKGSGKLTTSDTATTGQKKATFKIDRTFPNDYHTPIAYLVTTIGQGDSTLPSAAYAYTTTYILTICGEDSTATQSKIAYTKLHGSVGGASLSANADIVSAHWGTADTGSDVLVLSGTETEFDVTIAFGTRTQNGHIYIQPLFDFSLLT